MEYGFVLRRSSGRFGDVRGVGATRGGEDFRTEAAALAAAEAVDSGATVGEASALGCACAIDAAGAATGSVVTASRASDRTVKRRKIAAPAPTQTPSAITAHT